jgi:signal transduction histidine kinase
VLEISAREQRRIGQDLHDGLGQQLTGIAFMSKVQEQRLKEKHLPETEDAAKIVRLVNDAIHKTRELSRGLAPVMSDARDLMSALELHAHEVSDVFRIACEFRCEKPVLVHDLTTATHLYHIAREGVNNAIKHGDACGIEIFLSHHDGRGILTIKDDGIGFQAPPSNSPGMGLHIMKYRAGMAGGTLQIHRDGDRGTVVTCLFPVRGTDSTV